MKNNDSINIPLPYQFEPRTYQEEVYCAFFIKGIRRFCCPWHRRAGKDKTFINLVMMTAMSVIGNYIYLFPETTHAKKVIWNGIDKDGRRFLDHFPKLLIKRVNNTEMLIEFVNGSTFQLMGTDRYDKLRGINPIGIAVSEAQEHHPLVWDILRPILAENGGWIAFQGTPGGQNYFYEMYEYARTSPRWFCSLLTIKDTKRLDGTPVITEEAINEDRAAGMAEEIIQQEYYGSFLGANVGAYYGKWMKDASDDGRILDFDIDPSLPVYTFWDLGVDDATAIWFMQFVNSEIRLIHYYENNDQGLPFYADYLDTFARSRNLRYADHWAPFDIAVRELGTGRSRLETARSLGLNFRTAPNLSIEDGRNAVRQLMSQMWFHKTNCKLGISCLREYHREYDRKKKCYSNHAAHDWSCHGGDSMRYLAVSWKDAYANMKPSHAIKYNKFIP